MLHNISIAGEIYQKFIYIIILVLLSSCLTWTINKTEKMYCIFIRKCDKYFVFSPFLSEI